MSLKIPVTPSGIDPGTVRLVAQRLNHYATPGPQLELQQIEININVLQRVIGEKCDYNILDFVCVSYRR